MKTLLSAVAITFLIGCGGGGSNDTSTKDSSSNENTSSLNINDHYFSYQWYLAKNDTFYNAYGISDGASINAGDYLTTYTGKGVKIAVIDNGLYTNHEDLQGAIKGTFDSTTYSTNVSHNIGEYHGTEVTGVVGARANSLDIYGAASDSDIYFIKFKSSGETETETIRLFQEAVNFGADIINCSWGTENVSDAVKEYIQNISKTGRDGKGVLVVFASGNIKQNANGQYVSVNMSNDESSIPEVIAVGASNAKNLRAIYSNYGPYLDVIAPGGNVNDVRAQGIYTLYPYNQTTFTDGTSFSAPLVSGVLAMMLEANPNLTRTQILTIFKNTSDKLGNYAYDANSRNDYYGYGKINAKKAIDAALALK